MWRKYQVEILLIVALFISGTGYMYKQHTVNNVLDTQKKSYRTIEEIQRINALKHFWHNPTTKLNELKKGKYQIAVWKMMKKRLDAKFAGLSAAQLDRLSSQLLSIPVILKNVAIQHEKNGRYTMEITCAW